VLPGLRVHRVVGVGVVGVDSLREDAAAERRALQDADAVRVCPIQKGLGRPVEQRVAIVGEDGLEDVRAQELQQHAHRSAGDAEVRRDAFVAKPDQLGHRPARCHRLGEADPLRVVEVQQLQAVHAESLQRALHRSTDGVRVEPAVHRVDFGLQDPAGRQPAGPGDRLPDPALGLAVGIAGRGIVQVQRRVERGQHRLDGPVLGGVVAEQLGHRAEAAGADTDRRDLEAGAAEWTALPGVEDCGHRRHPIG